MAAKFELTETKGQYHFNLKAGNGQVILTSERYKTKDAAMKGIESVRKNGTNDKRYDKQVAKNGKPYFNLKSGNHQIIGTSQQYASTAGRDNCISSIMGCCADAPVKDLTEA